MADPVAPVAAPVAAPAPAPTAPAPAIAAPSPPPSAQVSSATVPEPVASPAAPVAATPAPAEPKPAALEPPPSLLSDAGKKPDVAAPAPADAPKAPETAPAPLPTYEAFKAPEGVELDAGQVGKFSEVLGKFEQTSKADHAAMQQFGQQIIDMYVAEQQRVAKAQFDSWVQTRDGWKSQFMNDPDIGGNNQKATLQACGAMIEQFGGTAEQIAELRTAFRMTGMGDHPALIRLLSNIGKMMGEGRPVPATVPKTPTAIPKSQRRYANSLNGGAN